MPTPEKVRSVEEIKSILSGSSTAMFTDFRGLTVAEISRLRRELSEAGASYKVLKNALIEIAAKDLGLDAAADFLTGPTAIAFGSGDPVSIAKVLGTFARANEDLEITGGLLDGQAFAGERIRALAILPAKEVLYAQLLGTMQAPVGALARVVSAPVQGLVRAIQQVAEQKSKEEGSAA